MTYRQFACAAAAVATLLLCALCLTAQVPTTHIPIRKEHKDSVRIVHDTVTRVETLTVVVPRFAFDSFFVHDTDTVRSRALLPLPIPIPLSRTRIIDCPPPDATMPQTATPEPDTSLLMGIGIGVLLGYLYVKRRRP